MVQWQISEGLTDYEEAVAAMEARVAAIRSGEQDELIWLVEHPPLYTGGTSADSQDLLDASRFPVYASGRGGEYTYHGPGQRIAYVMLDLEQRGKDIRSYVKQLEQWIITTLAHFDVDGFTREGRIGVWVNLSLTNCRPVPERSIGSTASSRSSEAACDDLKTVPRAKGASEPADSWQSHSEHLHHGEGVQEARPSPEPVSSQRPAGRSGRQPNSEAKIAALGIRVRKWVTYHGIAINVNPDLSHYAGIVPCGISEFGVTSLADLGRDVSMDQLDEALEQSWQIVMKP